MATPNLAITHIAASQNQKEVTANDAFDDLDLAMTNNVTIIVPDQHIALTDDQALRNIVFFFTGLLTNDRGIQLPSHSKLYYVTNLSMGGSPSTGFNLVFGTANSPTGLTVIVPPNDGFYHLLYCNGIDVIEIKGEALASLAGLTDVLLSGLSDGDLLSYNAGLGKWTNSAGSSTGPFDVGVFAPGVGTNNQIVLRLNIQRSVTFPAGAANSKSTSGTAATGSTTFTLKKNGSSFATIVYSASGSTGAFTQAADANFSPGDLLEIDGPATADATLADLSITLFGTRH